MGVRKSALCFFLGFVRKEVLCLSVWKKSFTRKKFLSVVHSPNSPMKPPPLGVGMNRRVKRVDLMEIFSKAVENLIEK